MKLSVIILNYNVRYFLETCLRSVVEAIANMDAEIIVIDNNSPDDSCEMVQNQFPQITLIKNSENVGFAKANNQGVKVAKGEYICILNPDTIVAEDTFAELLQFAETKKNLGAIGCKLIDGSGAFLPESKRNIPTPKVSLNKVLRGKNSGYYALILKDNIGKVDILVGAFMLMKKEVYEKVGGFDEDYFMYGEDIDLSYKIIKAGFQNYYYGNTSVIHYKGESTLKDKIYAKRFYGAMKLFYQKHFKRNILYDAAVALGAKLIPMVSKSKTPKDKKIKNCIILTENRSTFEAIKALYQQCTGNQFSAATLLQAEKHLNPHTEIIIDTHTISYKKTIKLVEKQLGYYKILPKNSTFIIGSDSAQNRGEARLLSLPKQVVNKQLN